MATRKKTVPAKSAQQAFMESQGVPADTAGAIGSFKKGGRVPKTGTYKLHKGEKVVPAKKGRR
jgi:hypothetical protein